MTILLIVCIVTVLLSLVEIPLVNTQSGDAEVTRNRNLQPFEESGNADLTRYRNLQTSEQAGNADATRYRNLQSLELAPPSAFSLTVEVKNSSGSPLESATVKAANLTSTTNSSGFVVMRLPYGTHNVNASHPDYSLSSWTVDLDTDKSITLTLASPYVFQGEIPESHIVVYPIEGGYDISLLDVSVSPCDVFFNWEYVGTLQNGTAFHNFTYGQLPDLIIEAARRGSFDYPKAWFRYLIPLALTPTTGEEGAFVAEPIPYAAASIFVNPEPPIKGSPAILEVKLHNPFTESLHISRIDFQAAGLNIGGYFASVGYVSNVTLEPGQLSYYNVTWVPSFSGHHCVRVVLTYSPTTQTIQRNLDIEADVPPQGGAEGSAVFKLRNKTEQEQNLVLKIRSDGCPDGWRINLIVNGKSYNDNKPNSEVPIEDPVSPGEITVEMSVQYPPGEGSEIQNLYIDGYIGGALIGGIRKIVVPRDVQSIWNVSTTFDLSHGLPFESSELCYGMSLLALRLYRAGLRGDFYKNWVAEVLSRGYNYWPGTIVEARYVSLLIDMNSARGSGQAGSFLREQYDNVYNDIANGRPRVLVLTNGAGQKHAVVAYQIENKGEGIKYIDVYDPAFGRNSPRKIVVITENSHAYMQPYGEVERYDMFADLDDTDTMFHQDLIVGAFSNYDLHWYDQWGRHTGFNYLFNQSEQQVANSTYSGTTAEPQTAGVVEPYNGMYKMILVGKRNGTYNVSIQIMNLIPESGWEVSEYWFNGTILRGQTLGFAFITFRDADGRLRIQTENIHETGVFTVALSRTVVGQGYQVHFRVHLQNYGNFVENLAASAYVNATELETVLVALTNRSSEIVTFTWDTTAFAKGNYTFSVYASPVVNEIEVADNNVTGGWVIVAMVGDVSSIVLGVPDGRVDSYDLEAVTSCYGAVSQSPNYNPNYDINDDGKIDVQDIFIVGKNFGQVDP